MYIYICEYYIYIYLFISYHIISYILSADPCRPLPPADSRRSALEKQFLATKENKKNPPAPAGSRGTGRGARTNKANSVASESNVRHLAPRLRT